MSESNNIEPRRSTTPPRIELNDHSEEREQHDLPQSRTDRWGVLPLIPGLTLISADLLLPSIFRKTVHLVQASDHISEENKNLVTRLLFGDEQTRLRYIAQVYSPEIAKSLEEMKDSKKRQELEVVMIVGSIDPNPNGPLGELLSMVGSLKFPESITIALGKISILNELAQHLLQVAARHGNKEQALSYAAALRQSSNSASTSISNELDGNSVVNEASARADRVNNGRTRTVHIQEELNELNQRIPNIQNPNLRAHLENKRIDLKNIGIV